MNDPVWRKASRSACNGNCAEVAALPGSMTGVRDSKDPDGPVLEVTAAAWAAFLARVKSAVNVDP